MLRKWDKLLLDACAHLGLLPPRLLKTIEFADAPELMLENQLGADRMAVVRREALSKLPPEVAAAIEHPARHIGRFVLVQETGPEGRATLFRGWDKVTGAEVEIAVVRSGADLDMNKLFRDVSAAVNFSHPVVAKVLGAEKDGSSVAIGMEKIAGEPIEPGKLALGFLLPFARDVAIALHEAHERGMIHLDLKPGNILISGIWTPKIRGFGLTRALSPGGAASGHKGLVGTPGYMAPEQIRGKEDAFDPRTDVYGFGATFYHWLTGQPPLPEDDPVETLKSGKEPVRLRHVADRVPKEIESVVMKCIQPDPKERYPNLRQVAEDIQRHLAAKPVEATSVTMRMKVQRFAKQRKLALLLTLFLVALCTYAVTYFAGLYRQSLRARSQDLLVTARAHYFTENYSEAVKLIHAAVEASPDDPDVRFWKIRLALRERFSLRPLPRPVGFEGAVEWYFPPASPLPEELRSEIEALELILPEGERDALRALSEILVKGGIAPVRLENCVAKVPWDAEVKLQLGIARLAAGQFPEARTSLEPLLKGAFQDPARTATAYAWLASALEAERSGRAESPDLVEKGLAVVGDIGLPSVTGALLIAKAQFLAVRGQVNTALATLRKAVALTDANDSDPDARAIRAEARTEFARLLIPQSRRDDASRELEAALRDLEVAADRPSAPLAWARALALRAGLHSSRGETARAIADLSVALEKLAPAKGRPGEQLEAALIQRLRAALQGAAEKALREEIAVAGSCLAAKPDYVPALTRRGVAGIQLAQALGPAGGLEALEGALVDLQRAAELAPGIPQAGIHLVRAKLARSELLKPTSAEGALALVLDSLQMLNALLKTRTRHLDALQLRAEIFARLAAYRMAAGHDPSGILSLIDHDIDRILEADPLRIEAALFRARSLFVLASAAAQRGVDPSAWVEKIARDCNEAIRRDSSVIDVLVLRGSAYLLTARGDIKAPGVPGALQQAVDDLSRAVAARPADAALVRLRGEAYLLTALNLKHLRESHASALKKAEADLLQATKLDPLIQGEVAPLLKRVLDEQ
ncbi:MAG TPA: serine/threonine-protein kinase [Planctomycetota bacterium]|nr:serine/threonine-protein kinase [Planctomycetota bacterium]